MSVGGIRGNGQNFGQIKVVVGEVIKAGVADGRHLQSNGKLRWVL